MKKNSEGKGFFKKLLGDDRGAILVMTTVYMPVIVGFFSLAVDMSYVLSIRNQLQVTAEAAALAGTTQLPDNVAAVSFAQQYAIKNMPTSKYGTTLATADIQLGVWATSNCSGAACFIKEPSGGGNCVSFGCNAVKATTRTSSVNNNALNLFFAQLIGLSQFNVSATAVAVFGATSSSQTWNVIIVQDISMSFSQELTNSKKADTALLNCVYANAGAGSKIGITLFTGSSPSSPYQPQIVATDQTGYNSLNSKIQSIQQCSSPGMPACSGSNLAAGMNSAITQLCPSGTCASNTAMVVLTDGIPNCGSTPSCSDQTLLNNAVTAANNAAAKGMDVITVYYGDSSSDASWLAALKRNNGVALNTPDATKLSTLMGQVCAQSLSHRLVW